MLSDAEEPLLTWFHHLVGGLEAKWGNLPLVDLEVDPRER